MCSEIDNVTILSHVYMCLHKGRIYGVPTVPADPDPCLSFPMRAYEMLKGGNSVTISPGTRVYASMMSGGSGKGIIQVVLIYR